MIDNLTDLKYFLEIAHTGNITRASERLGVTQPSLTLAIKRLEERTGMRLLERTRKGTHLTRQGESLKKIGERMLDEWDRELRRLTQAEVEPVGRYKFGVHPTVGQYTLPRFLPKLLEQFPQLEFEFMHDLSRMIHEKIISRECDLGFVINPTPHPDLVMQKLLSDEVTLFKLPHYKGSTLIYAPSLKQSQAILKNLRKVYPFDRELHSSSLEIILGLCEAGAGAAILPASLAKLSTKLRPVSGAPTFKDELYLVYRMERKSEASFRLLASAIKESVIRA